jgi:hypothetical protein
MRGGRSGGGEEEVRRRSGGEEEIRRTGGHEIRRGQETGEGDQKALAHPVGSQAIDLGAEAAEAQRVIAVGADAAAVAVARAVRAAVETEMRGVTMGARRERAWGAAHVTSCARV